MRVVVFLDLDDTIFQTRPKCPVDTPLAPAALDRVGEPLSFLTPRQQRFLELFRDACVIPTTARNPDAFRRLTLRFDSFAILDFGGIILLPGGSLDASWDAVIRPRAVEIASELEQLLATMQTFNEVHRLGVRLR